MKNFIFLGTAFFILAACNSPEQSGNELSAKELEALKALQQNYVTAWLQDDTTGVLQTLASDAVLMPSNVGPIKGMTEIKNFWYPNDGSRTKITAFTANLEEVHGSGDLAYLRGTSRIAFTYEKDGNKSELTNHGMFLTIAQRQNAGAWRITHQMWGPVKK